MVAGWCVRVFGLLCCVLSGGFLASREISADNELSILLKIPVVDPPCLVLARQCRKKKYRPSRRCVLPCGSVWLWVLVVGKSAWILDFALHMVAELSSSHDA